LEVALSYTHTQVGKLLSASEFDLFAISRPGPIMSLTATRLHRNIRRARTLRDKYRDLLARQRLATRARTGSKAGTSGLANQRTKQKAEVFTEVLQRFEKRLVVVEAAEARAARKKAVAQARMVLSRKRRADATKVAMRQPKTGSKAPAKRPRRAVTKGPRPTSESARSAQHAMKFKTAGQQAIHSHIGARGRRNQAKRDSRE
jgi:hypothetical protein